MGLYNLEIIVVFGTDKYLKFDHYKFLHCPHFKGINSCI